MAYEHLCPYYRNEVCNLKDNPQRCSGQHGHFNLKQATETKPNIIECGKAIRHIIELIDSDHQETLNQYFTFSGDVSFFVKSVYKAYTENT